MSSRPSFAIDVVEAGYQLDGTEHQWFDRVLERLTPELTHGLGTMGITYSFEGDRLKLGKIVGFECPPELVRFTCGMYENVPPDASRAIRSSAGNLCAFSEFTREIPPEQHVLMREAMRSVGCEDCTLVAYPDGDGGWIAFAALTEKQIRTFPGQRSIWLRVCAHLATAWRLRTRIGTAKAAVEAILSRDGRVLSASGVATKRESRDRLAQAADALGRARGMLRARDPLAAIDLWKGLVSGRWSLVDRIDSKGATVLVAHQNDPQTPDPRGLSPRERAIVELVLTGASNKHVAYTLGLGAGTVAKHLQQALTKLRVRSRVELLRLGPTAGAEAQRAAVDGEELSVLVTDTVPQAERLPLTDAEHAVVKLVAEGLTNAEIAARRGSAERTVANQIARIFEKVGVGSRAELVVVLKARAASNELPSPRQ
jgi:DNA-binding NarL/FixJ family response regulator